MQLLRYGHSNYKLIIIKYVSYNIIVNNLNISLLFH